MMVVTEFGKAVRKARIHTNDTLLTMSQSLGVSASFLSAIETGRSKVPADLTKKIVDFFAKKDFYFDDDLQKLADVSNGFVAINKLNHQHKMMVVSFANSQYSKAELDKICELLQNMQQLNFGRKKSPKGGAVG